MCRQLVSIVHKIPQITHEKLELWHFVSPVQNLVEESHGGSSLDGGLDWSHWDDFLYSSVILLIEVCGEINALLLSIFESED